MSQSRSIWNREYGSLRVIPSSTRAAPSKALLLFSELLEFPEHKRVLDAGCGNGRNSVYLAKKGCFVDAIDSAETALHQLRHSATAAGVDDRIKIHHESLQPIFPFESGIFDLVIDSYVFCHIIDDESRENYRAELHRVTRPGGLVYSSVLSVNDQYYRSIGNFEPKTTDIVTDPNNGVTKKLYSPRELKAFFGSQFEIAYFVDLEFQDIVLSKPYTRSILALILKKLE